MLLRKCRTKKAVKERQLLVDRAYIAIFAQGGPLNEDMFPRFTPVKFEDAFCFVSLASGKGPIISLRRKKDQKCIATLHFNPDGSRGKTEWPR